MAPGANLYPARGVSTNYDDDMEGEEGRLHISKGDTLGDVTIDNDKDGNHGSNRAGVEENSNDNKGKEVYDFGLVLRRPIMRLAKNFLQRLMTHNPQ